jgi:hypothetical protein
LKVEEKFENLSSRAIKNEKMRNIDVINSWRRSFVHLTDLMLSAIDMPYHIANEENFTVSPVFNDLCREIKRQSELPQITSDSIPEQDVSELYSLTHDLYFRGVEALYSITPDHKNLDDPVLFTIFNYSFLTIFKNII